MSLENNVNIAGTYYSQRSPCEMYGTGAVLLTTTSMGAGGGFVAAGPKGAVVGGLGGFAVGLLSTSTWHYTKYLDWKEKNKDGAVITISAVLDKKANETITRCTISQMVMESPVCLVTVPKVEYNEKDLNEWIEQKGECPITHKKVTEKDIRICGHTCVKMHKVCNDFLMDEKNTEELTQDDIVGIQLLKNNYALKINTFLNTEMDEIKNLVKSGQYSEKEIFNQLSQLSSIFKV